jgi:hypothetical protein
MVSPVNLSVNLNGFNLKSVPCVEYLLMFPWVCACESSSSEVVVRRSRCAPSPAGPQDRPPGVMISFKFHQHSSVRRTRRGFKFKFTSNRQPEAAMTTTPSRSRRCNSLRLPVSVTVTVPE